MMGECMFKFVNRNKDGFGKYCAIVLGHTCKNNTLNRGAHKFRFLVVV